MSGDGGTGSDTLYDSNGRIIVAMVAIVMIEQ